MHFFVRTSGQSVCQIWKFLASTVPEIRRGSQNFKKSRSLDRFTTPFDLILHCFRLGSPVANLHSKFEVSSFNRSRDMEEVPKFTHTHTLTHWLTDTQTDFIICPMLLTHWADNKQNADRSRTILFIHFGNFPSISLDSLELQTSNFVRDLRVWV